MRLVRPDLLRGRWWVLAACLWSAFALGGWATVARAAEPVPELSASSSAGSDSHDAPDAEGASGEALGASGQDGAGTADSKSGRGDEPDPGDGDESEARSELDPPVLPSTDPPTGDGVGDGSQGRDDSDPPPAPGPEEGSDSKEEPQVPKPATGRPDDKQDANDDSDPNDQPKPNPPKSDSKPKPDDDEDDRPKPTPPKPEPRDEPKQRADDPRPPQRYEPPPPESSEKKAPQRKKSSSKAPAAPAALGTGASNQTASLAPATAGGEAAAVRVEGNRFVSTGPPPPSGARPAQLAPYATVRIAGRVTRRGARVDVLSVRAPRDSRVTVRCRGRDCPTRSQSRIVSASAPVARANTRVSFRTMQRHLRGGTVLEVSVTKDGMIGKFTRFVIRAGKPPLRSDLCLAPGSVRPTRCA